MKFKMNELNEKFAFSLDEASRLTGLSKGHLRNESRARKLRLIKSRRRTLILAQDLRQYLESLAEVGK